MVSSKDKDKVIEVILFKEEAKNNLKIATEEEEADIKENKKANKDNNIDNKDKKDKRKEE